MSRSAQIAKAWWARTSLIFLLDLLLAVVKQEELESIFPIIISFVLLVMIALAKVALNR